VRQQRRHVLAKSVRQKERRTVGRHHLRHVVDDALRHRQSALADIDHQQQLALRVDRRPDPLRRARQTVDRLVFAHLPVLHGAEHGIQLIELYLLDVHLTQEVACKGLKLLGRFHQPVEHGIRVHLEDPRGGANAEPLRQAGQHADDQLHGDLLSMKDRAMMLGKVPFACDAVELAPGTATGMAIGTEVPQPEPATIATARMGTEVL